MNLPNKLTLLRVILVPFFLAAMLLPESIAPESVSRIIAAALFTITALTDFADGKIARKYNLVTNFGKFMDPLADKFMIITALFGATARYDYLRGVMVWIALVVVFRELAVTSLRLIACNTAGKVIAAIGCSAFTTNNKCEEIIEDLLPKIVNAAKIISGRLGFKSR